MTRSLPLLFALLVGLAGCSYLPTDSPRGRHADSRGRYSESRRYPTSARRVERGQERYVLCHNGRTDTYPTPAVSAHIGHGDSFGACRRYQDDRHRDDDDDDDDDDD